MRNSSLVEWACAENVTGLKHSTEAANLYIVQVVGEHCSNRRRLTVRTAGGTTRAYADMSSENVGEKPTHRKPEVSFVKVICEGLVGP